MNEDWGKGAKNNTIGWGQGACDNTIGWGTSQKDNNSWSGDTDISGCSTGLAQIDNVYSMSFDGINEKINLPSAQISTGDVSVSFWIKTSFIGNLSHRDNILGSSNTNSYNNIFTF